jgi:GNAT superfamily N-acetyltransferase
MDFTIRPFDPELDLPILWSLFNEFRVGKARTFDEIKRGISHEAIGRYTAVGVNGQPMGFARLNLISSFSNTADVEIAVLPQFRNRGLGKKLFDFALRSAKKMFILSLEVVLRDPSSDAIKFCENVGFVFKPYVISYITPVEKIELPKNSKSDCESGISFANWTKFRRKIALHRLFDLEKYTRTYFYENDNRPIKIEDFDDNIFYRYWDIRKTWVAASTRGKWLGVAGSASGYNYHTIIHPTMRNSSFIFALNAFSLRTAISSGAETIYAHDVSSAVETVKAYEMLGFIQSSTRYDGVMSLRP